MTARNPNTYRISGFLTEVKGLIMAAKSAQKSIGGREEAHQGREIEKVDKKLSQES